MRRNTLSFCFSGSKAWLFVSPDTCNSCVRHLLFLHPTFIFFHKDITPMKRNYIITLRQLALSAFAVVAALLVSCGDSSYSGAEDGDNGSSASKTNKNANTVTTDRAVLRIEFPALRKTGNQQVIVHRTSSAKYDVDRVNYCTEWDCDRKAQRWSCYQMHQGYSGNYSRVADFMFDPALPRGSYWSEFDYFPGFERGHICPSGDRTFAQDANSQTFYMSNMQPQYHCFNGYDNTHEGLWLRMENKLRQWAKSLSKTDTIFVCKGGTIDDEKNIIKRIDGKLIVPKYFFMAILRKDSRGYAAMAFWSEQTNTWRSDETLLSHAISVDELEKLTGIDFFCNLPDAIEEKVEKNFNAAGWAGLK